MLFNICMFKEVATLSTQTPARCVPHRFSKALTPDCTPGSKKGPVEELSSQMNLQGLICQPIVRNGKGQTQKTKSAGKELCHRALARSFRELRSGKAVPALLLVKPEEALSSPVILWCWEFIKAFLLKGFEVPSRQEILTVTFMPSCWS